MRITSSVMFKTLNRSLEKKMLNMYNANHNIHSGVMLHNVSDSPYEFGQKINYDTALNDNQQIISNLEDGKHWAGYTSEILGQSQDIMQTIYAKAVAGDNDNLCAENREALALEIDSQLEELLKLANQSYRSRHIFNGDNSNAQPFIALRDKDGSIEEVAQFINFRNGHPDDPIYVNYKDSNNDGTLDGNYYDKDGKLIKVINDDPTSGNVSIQGDIKRRTEITKAISISINGGKVFQPDGAGGEQDIFKAIVELRTGLQTNNTDLIGKSIPLLQDSMDRANSKQATAGIIYNHLETNLDTKKMRNIDITEALSKVEDTNISEAISEYQQQETTYSMALKIGARIMQASLINYI